MYSLTLKELHEKLKSKDISCKELVETYYSRIESIDADIDAYLRLHRERALKKAAEIDKAGDFTNP